MKDTRSNGRVEGQGLAGSPEQDLLVGDQPAQPDAVHPDPLDVGAAGSGHLLGGGVGDRRTSAAERAAAIRWAVVLAVPDGASALSGWCSSMISTLS